MSEIHLWRCFADICVFNDPWRLCGATVMEGIHCECITARDVFHVVRWVRQRRKGIGQNVKSETLWGLWSLLSLSLGILVSFSSVSSFQRKSRGWCRSMATVKAMVSGLGFRPLSIAVMKGTACDSRLKAEAGAGRFQSAQIRSRAAFWQSGQKLGRPGKGRTFVKQKDLWKFQRSVDRSCFRACPAEAELQEYWFNFGDAIGVVSRSSPHGQSHCAELLLVSARDTQASYIACKQKPRVALVNKVAVRSVHAGCVWDHAYIFLGRLETCAGLGQVVGELFVEDSPGSVLWVLPMGSRFKTENRHLKWNRASKSNLWSCWNSNTSTVL